MDHKQCMFYYENEIIVISHDTHDYIFYNSNF